MKRAACFILIAVLSAAPATGDEERELLGEISLLNLLNGLYLSEEQLENLVDLSRRADGLREQMSRESGMDEGERLESFRRLREELAYGADVGDDVKHDAVRRHHASRELRDAFKLRLSGLAAEAEVVFNDGQKEIIAGFKPCFTPPRDLKNPERVGQAGATGGIEKGLARLRKAPPERYERIHSKIIERHIDRFRTHGGFHTDEEVETERRRISGLIDSAMEADDVDFEMKKDEFARGFKPEEALPGRSTRQNVARFFLGPLSTGVLEGKLAGIRSTKTSSPHGLYLKKL